MAGILLPEFTLAKYAGPEMREVWKGAKYLSAQTL